MASDLSMHIRYSSAVAQVVDVACCPRDVCKGNEEYSTSNDIVFPRSGCFVMHAGRREELVDTNSVFFLPRLHGYRVSHPVCCGDDCTSLTFSSDVLADAFATYDPFAQDHPDQPFAINVSRTHSAVVIGLHRLRNSLRQAHTAPSNSKKLMVDDEALELLDNVVRGASQQTDRFDARRAATQKAHRELIQNTRVVLAQHLGKSISLPELARTVHSSPFHLSRVFRRTTGIPIHRYHLHLRLREAANRIAEGASDLAQLALSLGFSSHSHLCEVFRREFGNPPSSLRGHR